jgi:hypothetical protein
MEKYLKETRILDYSKENMTALIREKKWMKLDETERVKSIYNFVRDEILFGYNEGDNIPASEVLKDGYGQCNTKSTLLMALLRGVGIQNRIHGFTIDKALQKGAITGVWYNMAPKNLLHSWVEVFVNEKWYFLEGVILDRSYLSSLQKKNSNQKTTFCGFGVYTDNLQDPPIEWDLNNTYIQEKGINQDFGLFDSPDEFYKKHMQDLSFIQKFLFEKVIRKKMNRNVVVIRNGF